MKGTLTAACILALCAGTHAQQTELNDATGSLTSNFASPTFGTPFDVGVANTLDVEVRGSPGAGYILILGDLATPASPSTPVPGGESFDLDLGGPLTVLVDGINGGGALFPFVSGQTSVGGIAAHAFPMSPANLGQTYAMQAVVADPSSPFGLNFTAAAEWLIVNVSTLATFGATLTDEAIAINLPAPFVFYGQLVTQMSVSTKGLIDFDGSGFLDYSTDVLEFESGTASDDAITGNPSPSSPMVAAFWDDIETNGGGNITVVQNAASYVVTWSMAREAFGGLPIGTFSATIDFSSAVMVTIDHSGLLPSPGGFSTVVGVTSGDTSPASQIAQVDLVNAGAVNLYTGTQGLKQTIYEGFFGLTSPGPVDTSGTVMSFIDASGNGTDGEFFLF